MDFLWFGTICPPKRSHRTEGVQRRPLLSREPIPGNRPPFREIGHPSGNPVSSGRFPAGLGGRFAPESVAGFLWNHRPVSSGIRIWLLERLPTDWRRGFRPRRSSTRTGHREEFGKKDPVPTSRFPIGRCSCRARAARRGASAVSSPSIHKGHPLPESRGATDAQSDGIGADRPEPGSRR